MLNIRQKITLLDEPNYKYIGEYILAHKNIENITANEISENCFCSNSTVSRFCKRLGVENFYELKYLLIHFSEPVKNYDSINIEFFTNKINQQIDEKQIYSKIKSRKTYIITKEHIQNRLNYKLISSLLITYEEYLAFDIYERLNSCFLILGKVDKQLEDMLLDQLPYFIILSYLNDNESYDSWLNVSYIYLEKDHLVRDFEIYYIINLLYHNLNLEIKAAT